jgi:hypothetical protein
LLVSASTDLGLREIQKKHIWKDNVKTEQGWGDGKWIELAQDHVGRRTVVLTAMNIVDLLPDH